VFLSHGIPLQTRSAQVWHALSRDLMVLPAHPRIYPRTEWTMPTFTALPSQPKLVLIYRYRRDGRLSWPIHRTVSRPKQNSMSSTIIWRISQLLTVQTVKPHWTSGCTYTSSPQLMTESAEARIWTLDPLYGVDKSNHYIPMGYILVSQQLTTNEHYRLK